MASMVWRWAICRFRFRGPFLVVEYTDNSGGDRLVLRGDLSGLFPQAHFDFSGLAARLNAATSQVEPRIGPHANGPIPLALYYSLPKQIELPEIDSQFQEWLRARPDFDRIQPVLLSRARPLRRSLFHLPLCILATPETQPDIAPFLSIQWLMTQPQVRDYGIRVDVLEGDLELTLRDGAYSIVIIGQGHRDVGILHRLPEANRPRLLIRICVHGTPPPSIPGVAVLDIPPNEPGLLQNILLGIVHDFPLHEALKAALRMQPLPVESRLSADPLSNQSLRMSQALASLKRQADCLQAFFGGTSSTVPPYPIVSIPAFEKTLQLRTWSGEALFHQESTGLIPLAQRAALLEQLWRSQSTARSSALGAARALDATLLRLETEPSLLPVQSSRSLEAGAAYELRVHIGAKMPDSLVIGQIAPIDVLVGPPDEEGGHWLDLSVQGKDFRVLDSNVARVRLPQSGSTEPVYFEIRAPRALGKAELRILVHSQNHLVQSFVLEANIALTEDSQGTVSIRQEFARSEQFSNLDQLQPRALFIGLNQGQANTHEIDIKADQVKADVNLSARAYDQAVKDLRKDLRDTVLLPNSNLARRYDKVAPGQPPGQAAADALRKLARRGSAVYDAVFGAVARGPMRKALVRIQGTSKEKIQVVRFDPHSAFPWTLLYDWALPADIYGAPPTAVCLGTVLDANQQPVECPHTPASKVFCVRGFWGVRHYVEEMLPEQRNAQPTVNRPAADPVRIIASTSLPQAQSLANQLTADIGGQYLARGPYTETQLLDLLWQDPPVRPAVLIVLGHLEQNPIAGQPNSPRVELQPGSEWLTLDGLLQKLRAIAHQWNDPRTVVVLAPCESAATNDDTLNDFVTAINTAGAAAILGTQAVIGADQATEFARRIASSLWNSTSLGESIHGVRSDLVMSGDPGGFLFQSFGDIDLKVQ